MKHFEKNLITKICLAVFELYFTSNVRSKVWPIAEKAGDLYHSFFYVTPYLDFAIKLAM